MGSRTGIGAVTKSSVVANAQRLEEAFGSWPSFHDAEVLTMRLDRSGAVGPTLDAQVYVFEMTSEVDAAGFFVLKNQVVVSLRFSNVALERLRWFNEQNALSELFIDEIPDESNEGRTLAVRFESSYGVEASFRCGAIEVLEVEPYRPEKQ